jgi:hypothetical protein
LVIAATYGLYIAGERLPSAILPLYVLAGIGAGAAVLTPILMVRVFPPPVPLTGVSFSYNIAYAVFGVFTPLRISWFVHLNRLSLAHYVAAVTVLRFPGYPDGRDYVRRDLSNKGATALGLPSLRRLSSA